MDPREIKRAGRYAAISSQSESRMNISRNHSVATNRFALKRSREGSLDRLNGLKEDRLSGSGRSSCLGEIAKRRELTWKAKKMLAEIEVTKLRALYQEKLSDHAQLEEAIESMILDHEAQLDKVQTYRNEEAKRHQSSIQALEDQEKEVFDKKAKTIQLIDELKAQQSHLESEQERIQENIVVTGDRLEHLELELVEKKRIVVESKTHLEETEKKETAMHDSSYGLTGEAKELVEKMEELKSRKKQLDLSAADCEMERRKLYSLREELKGTIRVYCRVKKGSAQAEELRTSSEVPRECSLLGTSEIDQSEKPFRQPSNRVRREGSNSSSISARSTKSRPADLGSNPRVASSLEEGNCECASMTEGESSATIFSYYSQPVSNNQNPNNKNSSEQRIPCEPSAAPLRTICVHQSRSNATSTGVSISSEYFSYDGVFSQKSKQHDVFREVHPLINCAIDGYKVCIFAYGQTGSGKTYTMEGNLRNPKEYGITPRAIQTILSRKEELAKDGWQYKLICYVVEIYNESIRDLLKDPSIYENGGEAFGCSGYHTIKHQSSQGAIDSATITNVREKEIKSMKDFLNLYSQAVKNRSTGKTQINDRSSRSHCLFNLKIIGENHSIGKRSEGILCLIDLAGSERVNESGAQGKQLKEAIHINTSLLDLGKCIHAMHSGSIAPWRNSKLTYLLQPILAGRGGGKMTMLVTISNLKEHLHETINSLRFASRVNKTVVGTANRRITNC